MSQHHEDWWKANDCGPVAAAMLVEYYQHRAVEAYEFPVDMEIEKWDDRYRRVEEIGDWLKLQGVWVVYKDHGNWSIEETREKVMRGTPVIALINHPSIGHHYIVIVGITKSTVYIHDPWFGPAMPIQRDAFDLMWIWMIVPEQEPV